MMPKSTTVVPPPCLICKVALADWASLKAHLAGVHAEYRPNSCTQCDFTSPIIGEMRLHVEETNHCAKLNQGYDSYKAKYTAFLIDDHVQKAWEDGAGLVRAPITEEVEEKAVPAAEPIVDLAPSLGPNAAIAGRSGTVAKKGGPTKAAMGLISQRCGTAGVAKKSCGMAGPTKVPPAGGSGKVLKKTKCLHTGCGAEVCLRKMWSHITEKHVKLDHGCPVANCAKAQGGPNKDGGYKSTSALALHLKKKHGGLTALGADEKERYDTALKRVRDEVEKLRLECFPAEVGAQATKTLKAKKSSKDKLRAPKTASSKKRKRAEHVLN